MTFAAPGKRGIINISRIATQKRAVSTRWKPLAERFLISSHNIWFCGEIRIKY